jgi:hypothetical protein
MEEAQSVLLVISSPATVIQLDFGLLLDVRLASSISQSSIHLYLLLNSSVSGKGYEKYKEACQRVLSTGILYAKHEHDIA